ncbi:unnamed protein product [Closterium sp. NIES-65]|nr:unnamed protein product [Closterium sp. NIES-65]
MRTSLHSLSIPLIHIPAPTHPSSSSSPASSPFSSPPHPLSHPLRSHSPHSPHTLTLLFPLLSHSPSRHALSCRTWIAASRSWTTASSTDSILTPHPAPPAFPLPLPASYRQRAVNLDRELFLSQFPTLLHTHYHPHSPFLPLPTSYRQRAVNLDRALFQEHRGHKLMRDVWPAATRFHVFMGCNWIKASRPFLRYGSPPLDFSAARCNDQGIAPLPALHPMGAHRLSPRSTPPPPPLPPTGAHHSFLIHWPRRILMYMADVIDSDEHYFSTVACPAPRFNHYLLNASLHFATFAKAQGQPRNSGVEVYLLSLTRVTHHRELPTLFIPPLPYVTPFFPSVHTLVFPHPSSLHPISPLPILPYPHPPSPTFPISILLYTHLPVSVSPPFLFAPPSCARRELLQRQPDSITPDAWCSLPAFAASGATAAAARQHHASHLVLSPCLQCCIASHIPLILPYTRPPCSPPILPFLLAGSYCSDSLTASRQAPGALSLPSVMHRLPHPTHPPLYPSSILPAPSSRSCLQGATAATA